MGRVRVVKGSEGQSGTVGGFRGSDLGCLATGSSEIFSLWLHAARNCVVQRLAELQHKTPYPASASASNHAGPRGYSTCCQPKHSASATSIN